MSLFVKDIVSIGAVDSGDNPEADIVFWKAAPVSKMIPGSMDERLMSIRAAWADQYQNDQAPFKDSPPMVDSVFDQFIIVQDAADYYRVRYLVDAAGTISFGAAEPVALETAIVAKQAFLESVMESAESAEQTRESSMDVFDVAALPDVAQAEYGRLNDELAAAHAHIAELTADPVADDPIAKASEEVQSLIAKQREELEATQIELSKARTAQRDAEFVKRVADDGLDVLLGKAEEVGPVLRELADAAPDAFDSVYKNMQAAAQRVDLGAALGEIGEDQGETDPISKRDAWVIKMRKDGDARSVATLRTEFWELHPDERTALRESK